MYLQYSRPLIYYLLPNVGRLRTSSARPSLLMFRTDRPIAAQEVRDSSSGVTPCIVMKNDGVLYYQECRRVLLIGGSPGDVSENPVT